MRVRPFVFPALAATVVVCGPLLGYAAASRTAASAPKAHHVYRLDYVVSVDEPGKNAVSSTYTMNVEEGNTSDLRVGANVPLASPSSPGSPRQDVGLELRCRLTRVGDELLLHNTTEMSGPVEGVDQGARAIRKMLADGDAVASLGKPTVVASVQEPMSHARYQVTVTATKLR